MNAHEGAGQSSSFESLYGLRPKIPLRAAVPISLAMPEAARKKWQTSLRARNEDEQVRRAMSRLRKKGSKFKDILKKGDEVWVKKMGSVSSLKEQFQKGVIDEVPETMSTHLYVALELH